MPGKVDIRRDARLLMMLWKPYGVLILYLLELQYLNPYINQNWNPRKLPLREPVAL